MQPPTIDLTPDAAEESEVSFTRARALGHDSKLASVRGLVSQITAFTKLLGVSSAVTPSLIFSLTQRPKAQDTRGSGAEHREDPRLQDSTKSESQRKPSSRTAENGRTDRSRGSREPEVTGSRAVSAAEDSSGQESEKKSTKSTVGELFILLCVCVCVCVCVCACACACACVFKRFPFTV